MAQENERGLFASFSQSLFVAQDKVKDHGEDSYLLAFRENAGVCAVFSIKNMVIRPVRTLRPGLFRRSCTTGSFCFQRIRPDWLLQSCRRI